MRYIDEFRDKNLVKELSGRIKEIMPPQPIRIMEVCGTHTQAFFRFGLDKLLPGNLSLVSGPGCPVCVSPQGYIDRAIGLLDRKDTIILTFGDMLCVPGADSSLEKKRAESGNVRIAYSAMDSLQVARDNPRKKVIFLAVGFETTAPTIALSIIAAQKEKLKNLFFLASLKLIPPVIAFLLGDKRLKINGFLCPGHVSAIIGTRPYAFIPAKFKIGCCVTGFEPVDILEGVYFLLQQITSGKPRLANQYARVVKKEGNPKAKRKMAQVFKITDAFWRGLGCIPGSGLKIRKEFARFDAEKIFPAGYKRYAPDNVQKKCRCGDVLKGIISPRECPLYKKICLPDNPIGPCMVSSEGTCNTYYKYH